MDVTPFRSQGQLQLGDLSFDWGSGGSGKGAIPYGTYPVMGYVPSTPQYHLQAFPVNTEGGVIRDPTTGTTRQAILIHPDNLSDVDKIITAGCIGIAKDQWPAFRDAVRQMQKQVGPLMIEVTPNGARIYPASGAPAGMQSVSADQFIASSKEQTAALQSFLTERGFDPGAVDGIAGPSTKAAVQAFQSANGLTPDGVVGPQTKAALTSQGWGLNPEMAASKQAFGTDITGLPRPKTIPPQSFAGDVRQPGLATLASAPGPMLSQQASRPAGQPPVPPKDIPDTIPPAPPGMKPAEDLARAALTGDAAAIGAAGNKLLGVAMLGGDPAKQAITDYFAAVGQTPNGYNIAQRLRADPTLAAQLPETFGFKDIITSALISAYPPVPMPSLRPVTAALPNVTDPRTQQPTTRYPGQMPAAREPVLVAGRQEYPGGLPASPLLTAASSSGEVRRVAPPNVIPPKPSFSSSEQSFPDRYNTGAVRQVAPDAPPPSYAARQVAPSSLPDYSARQVAPPSIIPTKPVAAAAPLSPATGRFDVPVGQLPAARISPAEAARAAAGLQGYDATNMAKTAAVAKAAPPAAVAASARPAAAVAVPAKAAVNTVRPAQTSNSGLPSNWGTSSANYSSQTPSGQSYNVNGSTLSWTNSAGQTFTAQRTLRRGGRAR